MRGISQGEVAAMLQEGGQMPPHVQQLIDSRFCCLNANLYSSTRVVCEAASMLFFKLHSVHV